MNEYLLFSLPYSTSQGNRFKENRLAPKELQWDMLLIESANFAECSTLKRGRHMTNREWDWEGGD